jgi:hypothetical protein
MPINPPYRTDPFQNIVNIGFGGVFVAMAIDINGNETVIYSHGGYQWKNLGTFGMTDITGIVSPINNPGSSYLSGAGTFVLSGNVDNSGSSPGYIFSSLDGKNWTQATTAAQGFGEVIYSPQAQSFYAFGATGSFIDHTGGTSFDVGWFYSADGFSWQEFVTYDAAIDANSSAYPPLAGGDALSVTWTPIPPGTAQITTSVPGITPIASPQPIYGAVSPVMAWWTFPGGINDPSVAGLTQNPYSGFAATAIYTDSAGNQTTVTINGDNTVLVTCADGSKIIMNTGLTNTQSVAVSQGKFIVADTNLLPIIAVSGGGPTASSFAKWQLVDVSANDSSLSASGISFMAGQAAKRPS